MLHLLFTLCLGACICSCTTAFDEPDRPSALTAVSIRTTQRSGELLRTTIDPEDMSATRWCKGDTIVLWATPDSGATYPLAATPFELNYFGSNYSDATFTATISPMEEGDYTYFAAYPQPKELSENTLTYHTPTTQSGEYDGLSDVMVATPLEGGALQGDAPIDGELAFYHLTHAIRIRIPEGKNLMGKQIATLQVTFPQPVVGDIQFDVATTPLQPTYTSSDSIVTLQLATPLEEGDYAWIFVHPTQLSGTITFQGFTPDGYATAPLSAHLEKELVAGRITPLALTIPPELSYTSCTLSLTANHLGEELEQIHFTAPEGATFRGGAKSLTLAANEQQHYTIAYYPSQEGNEAFKQQGLGVAYETKSVLMRRTLSLKEVVEGEENSLSTAIPYLIDETFSGITSSSSNEVGTSTIDGLTGWVSSGRMQWWKGKSVAVRSYSNWFGPYHSRFNSPSLKELGLKSGATVKLHLTFNSDWKKNKSSSMGLVVGHSDNTDLNTAIAGGKSLSLSNNISANESNIPTLRDVTISGVKDSHYIAWKTAGKNGASFNYDYVYIDNIKVSITE